MLVLHDGFEPPPHGF